MHAQKKGTYRYNGWCRLLKGVSDLGITSVDKIDIGGKKFNDAAKIILK